MTTKTTKAASDTASAAKETMAKMETFVADQQKAMTEQMEKMTKGLEDFANFGQQNFDAMMKSSEVAAKAMEGIGSEVTAYSKKSFEDTVAAAQDFASAKTMTELFEKQAAFMQSAFEGWMHQTTKMNEIYVAAAKDITAPLGQRMAAASDMMKAMQA